MRHVALRGLWMRRTRALLTAIAVVLGVAMISGTYILTDTISSAFDGVFKSTYTNAAAVISGKEIVSGSASGDATVPAALLARVRRLPGVASASGSIFDIKGNSDAVRLLDHNGKTISTGGAPNFGFGIDGAKAEFNPLHLTTGRWATGPHEVVLDKGTASDKHFAVGDTIRAAGAGPAEAFRVVGIAKFGQLSSLGGATIAAFDVATAQRLVRKEGQFDLISVAARKDTTPAQLVAQIKPLLPASAAVATGSQKASTDAQDTRDFTKFIQTFLLGFAGLALFVGSFVIFNTLSITVAQRTREFATLRTLGATRRQVLRSVLFEGLVVGVLASLVGLFLGLALAKGLDALFKALSLSLPEAGTVFKSRTVVVSLLVGIVVTVVASVSPALRATRVPPIAAVREGAALPLSRTARGGRRAARVTVAAGVAALALAAFANLGSGMALLLIGVGALVLFIGLASVATAVVQPLARIVGAPIKRFGGPSGGLAQDNATRNPARTASTAAALMIGLALVTLVATLGAGLRNTDKNQLRRTVSADYVVTSKNGFDTFAAGAGRAIAAAPGVRLVSAVRDDKARAFGKDVSVSGVDGGFSDVYRYDLQQPDSVLMNLGADGAVVLKSFADDHGLRVGSAFTVTTADGRRLTLHVRAIDDPPSVQKVDRLLGKVNISQAAFDATFPRPKDLFAFVDVQGGASAAQTAALTRTLRAFPDAKLRTRAAWIAARSGGISQLLNLLYVLLALSVIVSLFGMVNTLVLSVYERTRELGMLRAVGMTQRQVREMIRGESVITALIGAALGLPLGLLLAAVVTGAFSDEGVTFSLPVVTLIVLTIVAIIAGLLAAIAPARRAARLNVLNALQYE